MKTPTSTQHISIAISGAGDTGHCGIDALEQAKALGREVAQHGAVTITGATTGFPMWSGMGALEAGGMVIGFSPASSPDEHTRVYRQPLEHITVPVFTGFGYSGRDLLMVRSADAVVFGCGKISSVNEFAIAYKEDKPIGVLQGDWMTDKLLKQIVQQSHDEARTIIFDKDPRKLVEQLVKAVKLKRQETSKPKI
jgi:uncharacterized protein (TIGR00725 family)